MGLPRIWQSSYVRYMHPTGSFISCVLSWAVACLTIWYNMNLSVTLCEIWDDVQCCGQQMDNQDSGSNPEKFRCGGALQSCVLSSAPTSQNLGLGSQVSHVQTCESREFTNVLIHCWELRTWYNLFFFIFFNRRKQRRKERNNF